MIARELEFGTECKRCNGAGKTSLLKRSNTPSVVCSCLAGRAIAASIVRDQRDGGTRLYNG